MTRVAIGVRDHSGWAVLVAVAGPATAPRVLARQRIALVDPDLPRQPYHAALHLDVEEGAALVDRVERSARTEAAAGVGEMVAALEAGGEQIAGVAVAGVTAVVPDSLTSILASHTLLHTAEGALYRDALAEAVHGAGVPLSRFHHKTVLSDAAAEAGVAPAMLLDRVTALGKDLGPPWQRDHKEATAAGLLHLMMG